MLTPQTTVPSLSPPFSPFLSAASRVLANSLPRPDKRHVISIVSAFRVCWCGIDGQVLPSNQSNNLYVFPGLALGAKLCQAKLVRQRERQSRSFEPPQGLLFCAMFFYFWACHYLIAVQRHAPCAAVQAGVVAWDMAYR